MIAALSSIAAMGAFRSPRPISTPRRVIVPRVPWRTSGSIRVALIGDLHGNPGISAGLAAAESRGRLDAVFLLGDNFARCGVESLHDLRLHLVDPLAALGIPIFAVLGNHDYGDPHYRPELTPCGRPDPQAQVSASSIIPNWHFPARNYILESPHATYYFVDTTPIDLDLQRSFLGSLTSAETYAWLDRELALGSGWKIVIGHHAVYGSSMPRWKDLQARSAMRRFGRFLEEHHVNLYISGHQHQMELVSAKSGAAFLISGASAYPSRIAWSQPGPATTHFVRGDRVGFATLNVSPGQLVVRFHDGAGAAVSGDFIVASRRRESEASESAR